MKTTHRLFFVDKATSNSQSIFLVRITIIFVSLTLQKQAVKSIFDLILKLFKTCSQQETQNVIDMHSSIPL